AAKERAPKGHGAAAAITEDESGRVSGTPLEVVSDFHRADVAAAASDLAAVGARAAEQRASHSDSGDPPSGTSYEAGVCRTAADDVAVDRHRAEIEPAAKPAAKRARPTQQRAADDGAGKLAIGAKEAGAAARGARPAA